MTTHVRVDAAPSSVGASALRHRLVAAARSRPWLTGLLTVAVVLRVLAMVAYRPALEFNGDSYAYLQNAAHPGIQLWHPIVYPLFLWLVGATHALILVPLLQHVMTLVTGWLVYRFVRDRGVGDLGGALAAAPLLLDAWQVDVEHFVLSEALFELLLVGGVYLLLRGAPRNRRVAAGGLLLALAILARTVGGAAAVLALLALAARRPGRKPIAVAVASFVLPLAVYAGGFHYRFGSYGIQGYSGRQLYGVAATFARCDRIPPETLNHLLCPHVPLAQRAGNNQYTWSPTSPLAQLPYPRVFQVNKAGGAFGSTVIRRQPLDYLRFVVGATLHYFAVGRRAGPRDFTQTTWQFPATVDPPPAWNVDVARTGFAGHAVTPSMDAAAASALRGYQQVGYLPGPLLGILILLGVGGAVVGRRRDLAIETSFLVLAGVSMLVLPSLGPGFDYRYVVPALLFVPAAAVIGTHLLRDRFPTRLHARAVTSVGCAVAALTLLTNAVVPSMTPASAQRARHVVAVGATVHLHDGLSVRLSDAHVVDVACVTMGRRNHVRHDIRWIVEAHLSVHDTGAPRLVQLTNISLHRHREPARAADVPVETPTVTDLVISARHPNAEGWAAVVVPHVRGVIDYVDPTGAGTAAWRYDVTAVGLPAIGEPCVPFPDRPYGPRNRWRAR